MSLVWEEVAFPGWAESQPTGPLQGAISVSPGMFHEFGGTLENWQVGLGILEYSLWGVMDPVTSVFLSESEAP